MPVKHYNKLVRDQIPASLAAKNLSFEARTVVDDQEFIRVLKEKLLEEAHEVYAAQEHDEILKELADVMEVVQAICSHAGYTSGDLENARVTKAQARGGFSQRQFLLWAEDDR